MGGYGRGHGEYNLDIGYPGYKAFYTLLRSGVPSLNVPNSAPRRPVDGNSTKS